jgi:hypothetical protein
MLGNGIILGVLTFLGAILLLSKLPRAVQKVLFYSKFIVDLTFTVGTYFALATISSSFAAALGAAVAGIAFSVWTSWKTRLLALPPPEAGGDKTTRDQGEIL